MARIRVFLLTFRRPLLLPRALDSLRRQTFSDWVCEVHNGDPEDPSPGILLGKVADSRFRLVTPPRRTGPVEAFNLAHRPAPEPYQSILEDDNWWEPGFLETMLAALEAHPGIELAWSNMRVWQELPANGWRDTGNLVWSLPSDTPPVAFDWPQLIHFSDFLYSNGAMLLRSSSARRLLMPDDIPVDMIEHVRERQMRFPILLVPAPLANFSLTLRTFRSGDHLGWGRSQALLGASFLATVPMTPAARRALWKHRRSTRPRSTNGLIFAGLLQLDFRFLRCATPVDWAHFLKGFLRRPRVTWEILRAKARDRRVWRHLCEQTAQRTAEARLLGFQELDAASLIDKSRPFIAGRRPAS